MIEPQLKYDLVLIKRYVRRRLWGCGRYLYRQRLSPPIQERRGLRKNESMVLGTAPDIRYATIQALVSTSIFLSNNSRPCTHTPYAFCYLPRPTCDFFSVLASDIRGLCPHTGKRSSNATGGASKLR
jgi:hypothetical protein